ncbi:hypothetical protein ADE_52490 [Achromobacter denitrificans]|nr:hypothetical protein ADE_52490 [Achromobacter denitrificans]
MFLEKRSFAAACAAALAAGMAVAPVAQACTRFVYHGAGEQVITARSMDWKVDVGTNLWVFPRGMERSGEAGPNSVNGPRGTAASSHPATTSPPRTA